MDTFVSRGLFCAFLGGGLSLLGATAPNATDFTGTDGSLRASGCRFGRRGCLRTGHHERWRGRGSSQFRWPRAGSIRAEGIRAGDILPGGSLNNVTIAPAVIVPVTVSCNSVAVLVGAGALALNRRAVRASRSHSGNAWAARRFGPAAF